MTTEAKPENQSRRIGTIERPKVPGSARTGSPANSAAPAPDSVKLRRIIKRVHKPSEPVSQASSVAAAQTQKAHGSSSSPAASIFDATATPKSCAEIRVMLDDALGYFRETYGICEIPLLINMVPFCKKSEIAGYLDVTQACDLSRPILVCPQGLLVDGRRRLLVAARLGRKVAVEVAEPTWMTAYQRLIERNVSQSQKAAFAAELVLRAYARGSMYKSGYCRLLVDLAGSTWMNQFTDKEKPEWLVQYEARRYIRGSAAAIAADVFNVSERLIKQAKALTKEQRMSVVDGCPVWRASVASRDVALG